MKDVYGILPTHESLNPATGEGEYGEPDKQVAYVMFRLDGPTRTRPTRVITSFGDVGWQLGEQYRLYHDQTGKKLGEYEVVGINDGVNGFSVGDVPDRKVKHSVFK